MKAPLSANIKQIFRENKYDNWIYLTTVLPKELQDEGFDIEVRLGGEDGTDLKYFLEGVQDVTDVIFEGISEGVDSAARVNTENASVIP